MAIDPTHQTCLTNWLCVYTHNRSRCSAIRGYFSWLQEAHNNKTAAGAATRTSQFNPFPASWENDKKWSNFILSFRRADSKQYVQMRYRGISEKSLSLSLDPLFCALEQRKVTGATAAASSVTAAAAETKVFHI